MAIRARAARPAPLSLADLPTVARARVVGPRVVAEPDCTVWVPDGWVAEPGPGGAWLLGRGSHGQCDSSGGQVSLDPPSLQILISRLGGIADEMGAVLRRAAYSPNIKERADCSAAVFTAGGELLAQAEHIPVHLGSMPASVAAVIEAVAGNDANGAVMRGDEFVVNDPFAGGTHLNDITVVAPCFVGPELVGWVANRAHHADVGGIAPGSMPPDATEIDEEGLRIAPSRLDHDMAEQIAFGVPYAGRAER